MINHKFKEKYEEEYNKLFIQSKSDEEIESDVLPKQNDNKYNISQKEYISKNPNELAEFFKDEGNRFFSKRQFDVALIYFTKAIEYDQDNKIFYSNRSACHLAKGNYKLALNDAKRSVEIDPSYVKGYYRGALANYEMNKLDEALEFVLNYKDKSGEEDLHFLIDNINRKRTEIEALKKKFPSSSKFLTFTNWLHQEDVYFPKLEIEFFTDDHRGVVSKKDILKDEIILKIPKENLISLEVAKNTPLGEQISTFMYIELNSPKHCLLTSYLLSEKLKNEESRWKHYLDILPKDYSSFPIFYTDEELSLLDGSPFKQQILEKKEDIKKDYEIICGYIPEFSNFCFKDFCEGRMAVSSRIFGVKIDFKKTDVLAPFADLLNHKRPRTTHWFYDERYKSFVIQSLEDIPKGLEVYDSYGKKCNSRFLLNYGFTIEDNDANEYPITLKLDDSCPLFEEKKKLFKKEQEMTKKFRISENIVDYSVIDFFSYLRFILFDGEIEILLKIISDNKKIVFEEVMPSFYLISPINMQQEIKVLQKIRDIMKEYLNLYKSKLQEDLEIINSINNERQLLTNNQRNCIIMRISEKKVLHFYLNFAEYCLELFEMTDVKEKIELDFRHVQCPYEFYIHEVVLKYINKNNKIFN